MAAQRGGMYYGRSAMVQGQGQGKWDEESKMIESEEVGSLRSGAEEKAEGGKVTRGRPWRLSVDLPRAGLCVVIAGVAYLL